jgi:hypothetical protein
VFSFLVFSVFFFGCHQLVFFTMRPTSYEGLMPLPRVSDWSYRPSRLSETGKSANPYRRLRRSATASSRVVYTSP